MDIHNFRSWLIGEVREILGRKTAVPPLMLWLDPEQQWLDLAGQASRGTQVHRGYVLV